MKMILSLAKSLPEKLGGGAAGVVRKVLLAWLLAVTVEYLILPAPLRDLQELLGLAQMSGLRILVIAMAVTAVLLALSSLKCGALVERWAMVAVFGIMALAALAASFTWAFLVACLLILAILVVYGRLGWNGSAEPAVKAEKAHWGWVCLTTAVAVGAFAFVSAWTVGRVYCMHASTYDFGIFAQLFHNMKETGLPMTTLERDGWMSHFDVHVSPIYYLMLPFYMLVPTPATLQVLQAAVMASAAIPLWLIGKRHGLSGEQRMLLCALLRRRQL